MLRLIVPSVLGLVGFSVNFVTISRAIEPVQVLAVGESIPAGGRISEQALIVVKLPGQTRVMRANLIPADARGIVLERKVTRPLKPNQILLYSDLDTHAETPSVPDHCELVFVALEKLPCRRDLLQRDRRVYFLCKPDGDRCPGRIGPFEVFEGPAELSESEDGTHGPPARGDDRLGVLLDRTQPEQAGFLRDALARDALRAIEVEPR
jgi:hypothetical protein